LGVIILKNRNLFPQSLANHNPTGPFIILSHVESTNNYAMAKVHSGINVPETCFLAFSQTAGKGQRGKQWNTAAGENITMSIILSAPAHKTNPFVFSAGMALACYDFIKEINIEDVSIKWPNDVYIGDRKAGGILIETVYKGSSWEWAIVGIGINMNQIQFDGLGNKAV
jgi:BirA family biotin operon repressor/biotin-[acetyl-CoA-carboxylase] ligase